MSLVFLKRLLFPAKREVQRVSPVESSRCVRLCPEESDKEATNLSIDSVSTSSTLDVEAQQCDHCRPRSDDTGSKRRKLKIKLNARMISDAIIGLSDGLTVPFALTAGLSSLGDTRLVILGGLAELIAGAISMGLGGFIGAKSEAESYSATVAETKQLIQTSPCQTSCLVQSVFRPFGLSATNISVISKNLHDSPEELLDFLMRFHHQMPEPATSRPFVSAATIALGYFLGGLVPLIPYFCVPEPQVLLALWWSIGVMAFALFVFGWVKTGVVSGWSGRAKVYACVVGGVQMVIVGGCAAGAAVGMVKGINHGRDL